MPHSVLVFDRKDESNSSSEKLMNIYQSALGRITRYISVDIRHMHTWAMIYLFACSRPTHHTPHHSGSKYFSHPEDNDNKNNNVGCNHT